MAGGVRPPIFSSRPHPRRSPKNNPRLIAHLALLFILLSTLASYPTLTPLDPSPINIFFHRSAR